MTDHELLLKIWELAEHNAQHISVYNHEMGAVQSNLEWLNWCIKGVIVTMLTSIGLSIWNIVLSKKKD